MKKMNKKLLSAIEYSIQNPTASLTKVGELFGISRHTLAKYKKDGIYLDYRYSNLSNPDDEFIYCFSEKELHFIDLYLSNPNLPYNQIIEKSGFSIERRTLYKYLDILGKEKTEGGAIKYHYDRNRFKTIETEEDAYWLGFITADGCIIENRWLAIGLAEKDTEHLVKFCSYIGLNETETKEIIKSGFGGAYTGDNVVNSVKICSLDIIKNLEEKGITPKKSGKEIPYICSSKELEKAYIRGLIDGDGYIRSTQYGFGIVGSKDICEYVQNFIINNIHDISSNHIREHGIIYKLEVNGKDQSFIILSALYENAQIYLDRKYQLYIDNYKKQDD